MELLDQARTDVHAQHAARRDLIEDGAIRKSALIAQLYVERSRNALQRTGVGEPWRSRLVALLDGLDARPAKPTPPNQPPQPVVVTGLVYEASFNR